MAAIPVFFGLNLGHFSIKLVEIERANNKAKLQSIGSTPTSVGLLNNDSPTGIQTLAGEVTKAIKTLILSRKLCNVSS